MPYSRNPVDSIRDAVLTVSPNRQYRGMVRPTTPATQGPGTRMCLVSSSRSRTRERPRDSLTRPYPHCHSLWMSWAAVGGEDNAIGSLQQYPPEKRGHLCEALGWAWEGQSQPLGELHDCHQCWGKGSLCQPGKGPPAPPRGFLE